MIMIGCAALNLAFAARQAAAFGSVSAGVLPVNAFELWYVANGLVINEAAHTYTSTQHVQITCTSHTQHRGSACKVRTLSATYTAHITCMVHSAASPPVGMDGRCRQTRTRRLPRC